MEISKENAELLLSQLQHAHRLSVASYQRILALMDDIATQVGCHFWYWHPLHTNRPSKGNSKPSLSWTWDFIPLYASQHAYFTWLDGGTKSKDYAIIFKIYIEDSFQPENGKKRISNQPNPISLSAGNPTAQIYIIRPKRNNAQKPFYDLWAGKEWPLLDEKWQTIATNINAIGIEFPLAKLLSSPKTIVEEIKKRIAETMTIEVAEQE